MAKESADRYLGTGIEIYPLGEGCSRRPRIDDMTSLCIALLVLASCAQPSDRQLAQTDRLEPIGEMGDHHVIYVPAYSHVYSGDHARRFQLATTLSVHNISFRDSVWIEKVRYYDTDGRLVYDFVKSPVPLHPMETYKVQIAESDTAGGSGANFLVEWVGQPGVPAPIAEAVHIGISSIAGLSFVTRGVPLIPYVVPDSFPGTAVREGMRH